MLEIEINVFLFQIVLNQIILKNQVFKNIYLITKKGNVHIKRRFRFKKRWR